ncbi:MAG: LytTR family transcriptional regulator [Ruminiclostridium sp.]|nr:LytTR family transcriptional regulator [Ruminiclostridium sp.]
MNLTPICLQIGVFLQTEALSAYGFIRIHKSFIVNTRFIFSVERNNIILTDNSSLPVSRTKTEEIKQAMIKFARD